MMECNIFSFIFVIVFGLVTTKDCVVDDIPIQSNFALNKYVGEWYEMWWLVPFDISDPFTDYSHTYEEVNSTSLVAHVVGRSYEGECFSRNLHFYYSNRSIPKFDSDGIGPQWILKTDYENYSVTYGCQEKFENGTCSKARAWIWSRKKTISDEHVNEAKSVLENACIAVSTLRRTTHNKECMDSGAEIIRYPVMTILVCSICFFVNYFFVF